MPDFLKKLLESLKNAWEKTSLMQKLIGAGVLLAAIIAIVLIFVFSSSSAGIKLFTKPMAEQDFDRITTRLTEFNIPFTTKNKTDILVSSEKDKNRAIMLLAEEGSMPEGKYSFLDIIESKKITQSKFMEKVQIRAALEGKLEKLLESSDLIQAADISFTMPEDKVFVNEREPVKVAVMLTPNWGVELTENKKAIKGIEGLIINSIDGAVKEHVVVTDNFNRILNDDTGEDEELAIMKTKENLKIRENLERTYEHKIRNGIIQMIPDDRISVTVNIDMNFDQEKSDRLEILPVVLKADDPATPYDDGERTYSIPISSKKTNETFEGPNWIPEGPPGFDDNVPPAYKGALEQITKYLKNEEIINQQTGEAKTEIVKDPWEIVRKTASVAIDGTYKIVYDEKGNPILNEDKRTRKREYIPVTPELINKVKGFVEQSIGMNIANGDSVKVYEMQKDRLAQFEVEDDQWRNKKNRTIILLIVLGALLLLIVVIVIYRVVAKEMERRRRLREEELARQHQLAREMALKSAEEEGVEVEMSIEDKARLEMQENAINLAREHPEDVAQLIRTWLSEE
ncbi:MAG: flagellar M-ring protein FliF [Spirochaetes bacterium]|nr:flagellar M-ring protein FliF [Spirochaetota bacterium]